jgi:hypothetical protein
VSARNLQASRRRARKESRKRPRDGNGLRSDRHELLLNPDDMREAGIRVLEKSVSSQEDNGGRDRDRTCDPYHVNVAILAEVAENTALFAA